MEVPTLHIDVFADIACPWCYIGERRLRQAADAFTEARPYARLAMHWQPFQLQPDLPPEGLPWRSFAEQKFGSWERAQASFRHLRAAADGDDIDFRFDAIQRANNTADAHRLILFARKHGREWPMAEALFAAYFTHGRDLNDPDVLADVAAEAGVDADAARAHLASEAGQRDVALSQDNARAMGIRGVPFYLLSGAGSKRYGLSGAQPVATLQQAFEQVLATPADTG